ncbi:FliA/WhiG family RNA polymerase sigma factor [Selenomonas massiliensis]|uniref:FliA/WhiG family RNA polymerase sigma factor n=1 Tax=Selenomonas massiliensis TaxID=2058293 RepID=UPI000D10D0E3|nr:FliA/WhiG family RNA polymerase sigma factor [Selenomonas massiliensis]
MPEPSTENIEELWQMYATEKSVTVRNRIAEYYLPLVRLVAGRIAISLPQHVDREDLLSSGFFGLLDAIERYELDRGNKFETYAGVRVRGAMLDHLRAKDWIPVSVRQNIKKYEKAVAHLEGELGRTATDEELAAELDLTIDGLHHLEGQVSAATIIPLEEYLRTDSPASMEDGPVEHAEWTEVKETLAAAIEKLPEKERIVVGLYYYDEMTLKEIAAILHLSEARISQLHTKAIFRMRGTLARMNDEE